MQNMSYKIISALTSVRDAIAHFPGLAAAFISVHADFKQPFLISSSMELYLWGSVTSSKNFASSFSYLSGTSGMLHRCTVRQIMKTKAAKKKITWNSDAKVYPSMVWPQSIAPVR